MTKIMLFGVFFMLVCSCAVPAQSGTLTAAVEYQEWKDATRSRAIPVKIYLPGVVSKPLPVVIFSHGLGGSREAAAYLGNYWAEHGYIGVFIQHPGSDESFWRPTFDPRKADRGKLMGKFRETLANPLHAVNRGNDVHFVLNQLERLNSSDPKLRGKLDLNEIAIAGHSFGSWTALTASGQRFFAGANKGFSSGDRRIKAAIYLSPTPPRKGQDPSQVYGGISVPGMHFTGTLDSSPVNNTKAEERRLAFDNISNSDQYLIILNGADHGVFGGRKRLKVKPEDENFQEVTEKVSTAFLDAYLKHDGSAMQWLSQSAPSYVRQFGTYETKRPSNALRPN